MNQKGQLDLIGNVFEIIKTQPYILPLLFLALIYGTTLSLNIAGFNLSIGDILNSILGYIFGSFGFNFDWRIFVIIAFFTLPVLFILNYGNR